MIGMQFPLHHGTIHIISKYLLSIYSAGTSVVAMNDSNIPHNMVMNIVNIYL